MITVTEADIRALPQNNLGKRKICFNLCGIKLMRSTTFHSTFPIFITVMMIFSFPLSHYLFACIADQPSVIISRIFQFAFLVSIVKASFTDPGYIKRTYNPEMVKAYPDKFYCKECMVTWKEKKEKNIGHCMDCGRCCENLDHHCVVIGNCVGKNNLYSFYCMIGTFMLFTLSTYYCLFLLLTTNTEGCVVKDMFGPAVKKAFGIVGGVLNGKISLIPPNSSS